MKKCAVLYNKNASGFKMKNFYKVLKTIAKKGYIPVPIESTYPEFIIDNIELLNDIYDIVFTMGGDGTVSNAYEAFGKLDDNQKALYGHIPSGTTNDMGPNTTLPRYNPNWSTKLLLDGKVENRDVVKINNQAIAYVAAIGILAPATYLIDKSGDKKDAGTFSYIKYGARRFFEDPELYKNIVNNPYKISYEANGRKVDSEAIFIAILNGKSFANLRVKSSAEMTDGNFDVIILKSMSDLLKTLPCLLFQDGIDLSKNVFSTNHLKLTFNDRVPFYPVNCDGDGKDLLMGSNILEVKTEGKVKQLVGRTYKINEDE